jgi:hypothetical protein
MKWRLSATTANSSSPNRGEERYEVIDGTALEAPEKVTEAITKFLPKLYVVNVKSPRMSTLAKQSQTLDVPIHDITLSQCTDASKSNLDGSPMRIASDTSNSRTGTAMEW